MISIVVPVYNVEQYLSECLTSLVEQTFSEIEIICVNDGSTDGSLAILTDFSLNDPRIRIITQENQGLSAARNRGIAEAKGEWIMFVDSDDWIDRDTCERAYVVALEKDVDVVFWGYVREFSEGRSLPRSLMNQSCFFDGKEVKRLHRRIVGPVNEELSNPELLHSWGTIWGKLYRREVVEGVKLVDTKTIGSAEDVLFNIEVFFRVRKAFYIHETKYHYRKSNQSFTRGYNHGLKERWDRLYMHMQELILSDNNYYFEAYKNRISLGVIGLGLNECSSEKCFNEKRQMLSAILNDQQYVEAIGDLSLKYFPLHWRFFFWSAKRQYAGILLLLIIVIDKIK